MSIESEQLSSKLLERVHQLYREDKLLQCSRLLTELRDQLTRLQTSDKPLASDLQSKLNTEFIQTVQRECDEVHAFKQALGDDQGWTLSYDGTDTRVLYRREESTSTHSIQIVGTIQAPLVNIAALLYEADLYHQLFWYVLTSTTLPLDHESLMRRAVHVTSFAPWPLHQRDIAIYAYAVDALDGPDGPDDSVLVLSRSLRPHDRVANIPEPASRVVRADIHNSGFELQPVSPGVTRAKFLYNIDPHLNFVPSTLVNWATRTICRWSLRALEARAHDLAQVSPDYLQRLDDSPVYERIRNKLVEYWAHKGLDYDPSTADRERICASHSRLSDAFDPDAKPDVPPSLISSLLKAASASQDEPGGAAAPRWRLSTMLFGNANS